MHRNEFISVLKFSGNEGKLCGNNLSMEMILFLYVNSAEMRETEGILRGKKLSHGNEFISVRKFCGNEGN